MKPKRPTPPECPICTSREVVSPDLPRSGIRIIDMRDGTNKRKPWPKVTRYRCKQCGHRFTTPPNS